MVKQAKVIDQLTELGYKPKENRAIVVGNYAQNLSAQIANFFSGKEFYFLQICEDEILIADFKAGGKIIKDKIMVIKKADIKNVKIEESGINDKVFINLKDGTEIKFDTQQKELSMWRNSGTLTSENLWGDKNWHSDNFDETIKELESLGQEK